jgi:hypothetical protein
MTSNEFKQDVGYVTNTMVFDYIQHAILEAITLCTDYNTGNPLPLSQAFVSISNLPSVHEQTVNHCETYGKNCYVNGAWLGCLPLHTRAVANVACASCWCVDQSAFVAAP